MQIDRLSQKGIEKLINNVPSILQVSQCTAKNKQGNQIILLEISDGYAKIKKCAIMFDKIDNRSRIKLYDVIRIEQAEVTMKNGMVAHVILNKYSLVRNDINVLIGQPLYYHQFKQKGNSNPKGDNMFPIPLVKKKQTINNKSNYIQSIFQEDKPVKKKQQFKNNQNITNNAPKRNINQYSSDTNTTKSVMQLSKPQPKMEIKQNYNTKNNNPKDNPRTSTRYDNSYTQVYELYQGLQDWKLKVRIIFTSGLRTFIKKSSGQQSQIFSFQAADMSGAIQATVFGEIAEGFSQVIQNDKVYQISGGKIYRDQKQNRLKISLNQKSEVNLLQEDNQIPFVGDKCITPSELLQKDIGTQWNVIALVKDTENIVQFVSKNGKNCKKKQIYLCDPQAKIEIPLTLWFQKAENKFQKMPYALQGISVSTYNGQKQFTTSLRFSFREAKQHQFKKYMNLIEKINFQNPVQQNNKKNVNNQITNFLMLRQEAQRLQVNASIIIQKVCYISAITTSNKNYYLSCPNCKKKVFDQVDGQCDKCGKRYQKGQYRYLLNVGLTDQVQMIWGTAYDQAAQIILSSSKGQKFTAQEYVILGQQALKQRVKDILDRQMKITILAKKDSYAGQSRVKFGITKAILNIDYEFQTQILQKKIQFLMRQLQSK